MLKPLSSIAYLSFVAFLPVNASASPIDSQKAAIVEQLGSHPQWLKLLHFQRGESLIESDAFFFAPEGRVNPKAELLATLEEFENDANRTNQELAQCRFPARYLWLKKQLGSQFSAPKVRCEKLEGWQEENQLDSISLIFVTGYMGNPASFFGHLLMKLNKEGQYYSSKTPLLDSSVNFGANTGQRDNPIKYVTYGLLGGYSASFSQEDYYRYEFGYAEGEQRELWEYELNLTEDELKLLESHLWELQGKEFRYYFLDGNCATYMASFVSIVLEEPLLKNVQPWDMPLDIFKALPNKQHNNQPLVKSIDKRESKYSRIKDKYLALTGREQEAAKSLTIDKVLFANNSYAQLSSYEKSRVLNVMFDYYELTIVDGSEDEANLAKSRKIKLMQERLKLPALDLEWEMSKSAPPHLAQNPMKIGLSTGYNSELGGFGQLNFRAAYYDYLYLETSRFNDSNATFFDGNVRFSNQDIWLDKFDVFNVSTLNIRQVDLFEDSQFAWSTRFTIEQKDLSCNDCERARWFGSLGKATKLKGVISFYAMPGVNVDLSNYKDSELNITFGALYTASEYWKTHLKLMPASSLGADSEQKLLIDWESRFGNEMDWDVRLNVKHNKSSEVSMSYARYF